MQESTVITRPANRSASERDQIILRHTGLVRAIARRYAGRGIALDDIVQTGYIGLISAVDRFDAKRGVPIEAYAARTIEGEIMHLFRDRGWAVRVPRGLQELSRRVSRISERLNQELGRRPTAAEIAKAGGHTEEEVLEALRARQAYIADSLADTGREGEDGASDAGRAARALRVDDLGLALAEHRGDLERAMRRLPAREREIVRLRFGHDLTQSEIAERIGVSQMHVSRLLRSALNVLREELEAA
jgi:RNA polymerase sigma-B factor